MYVRRDGDQVLDFGHRGWLLDESFLFYDRQTDSLWVQATGTCVKGKFKGQQLQTLPVTHTTWGQWRALHPETVVLAKPVHLIERYRHDSYQDYYERRSVTFGLAVFVADGQKLYPLDRLEVEPVAHDTIGDQSVLVVFHSSSNTAVAFEPVIEGTELQFELAETTPQDVWLRERQSGTIWSGLTGRPQDSATFRTAMRQLRTTQFTVANWHRHFPNSPTYPP